MDSFWKSFLHYKKTERRAIYLLCSLLVIIVISHHLYPFLLLEDEYDYSSFTSEIAQLEIQDEHAIKQEKHPEYFGYTKNDSPKKKVKLFSFDPNNLPKEQWIKLGFSEKQATSIKKYEASGGRFRAKEDLRKLYVVSEEKYQELYPYIFIEELENDSINAQLTIKPNTPISETGFKWVDINKADTTDFKSIKGIGSYTAKKIVNYRNKLGGFTSKKQLYEIWGLKKENVQIFIENLICSTDSIIIRKIDVNEASIEEIKLTSLY